MKRCAAIGGTGFIGKNLLQYFSAHGVICNAIPRKALYDIKKLKFDEYDAIIHMAGLAHDTKGSLDTEKYYRANFELTKKLYDKFLSSEAKKFIFISSVKAMADDVEDILTENILPNPKTTYGLTKLMAEQYIMRQQLPAGKCFYILRPCMTHGRGNKGNLNLLYKVISKGVPYPLAGFKNERSFLSVENLSFIIHELITRDDIPSDTYNVADDEPLSTTQVIWVLADSLKKKPMLWKIPPGIIYFFARIGDILRLPLNTERLKKLTENYVVSNSKIKAALKKPLPLNAIDGLKQTALSFNEAA
jgi:nucleoside-diphosphate-sugar epimerase